ncbi:hypothetical protein OIE63_25665 [Streptomyces sp. NBC_01795]|uniref:hypothetical protein n=1 Tax=Streptomyces sp. NBC_01795 TaxID=2975943 RepID=UPI002DD8FF86|nr:hypothetical protein [Streptomyces sp. NBC_01795]WSA94581.1 hypothetical protein OIE63_25665 [Streptomyces sp. NBC_01795]
MRIHAMRAAVIAAGCAMVLSLASNGCTRPPGSPGAESTAGAGQVPPSAVAPPAGSRGRGTASAQHPGGVFLAEGECGTHNRQRIEEVPCDSERAAVKVVARHEGARHEGARHEGARHEGARAKSPRCPAHTDFVLHISERFPEQGTSGGTAWQGHACARYLEPPHPGDPGGGGGPRTVVGDCVYATERAREVKETPCTEVPGRHRPQFRVERQLRDRTACPAGTALYVDLGGVKPVGCARRV